MKDKLITVATHSYEKAQFIKMELEREGIECYLSNINLIQGAFSGGVKVRISEEDLDKGLKIIEHINEVYFKEEKLPEFPNRVLVPVDFSEYSYNACVFAISLAKTIGAEIDLMHTYFSPLINTLPYTETFSYDLNVDKTLKQIEDKAKKDMDHLHAKLKKQMKDGSLPTLKTKVILNEGVPEEEILSYAKKYRPQIIVMGTRGKNRKNDDLIGSVTAEVIERAKVPVLAIPEDTPFNNISQVKTLAYITSFADNDLEAIDKLMRIIGRNDIDLHCVHLGHEGEDPWDEVQLSGLQDYLNKKYTGKKIECELMEGDDLLVSMDKLIREKKIDIITLITKRRNIIARMFNPSIARRMIFHTDTPLLVFHA
ncbi:universal stress protein [Saccharicrinis sp. FJH62]|uniref:universal stress protein n=1 Tax=Saccharicrinis sp. FJH62 TaxID=3344657 RepID=UPI0035D4DAD0